MDAAVARLDDLKGALQENLTEYQDKQDDVERDRAAVEDLLAEAKAAQQVTHLARQGGCSPKCFTVK